MEKIVAALTGAVTIAGAVLFLFGVSFDEKKSRDIPPVPPLSSAADNAPAQPVPPPQSSTPESARAAPSVAALPPASSEPPSASAKPASRIVGDPATPAVLEQDGVTVQVTAEPVSPSDAKPGAPATAKVKVKVQTKKPAKVEAAQPYIVLRPENGPHYSLPPSDYRFATASGDTVRRPHRTVRAPESADSPSADTGGNDGDWPRAEDTVESELEFLVNLDILSRRFSVKLPDLMVDGKSYAVPPVTFEQKTP